MSVYSLNVPLPSSVAARAADLGRRLPAARARQRGEHTLVVKRLGRGDAPTHHELEARAREALAGQAPFAVRVAGVERFPAAARGASPVVYLRVESPELEALHHRLCETFDPVEGVEGEDYVPHVTVARGGSVERARALSDDALDPLEWTVEELEFWDAERSRAASSVSLPA